MLGLIIVGLITVWALIKYKQSVIFTAVVLQPFSYLGTGIDGVRILPLVICILLIIDIKNKFIHIVKYGKNRKETYPFIMILASGFITISYLMTEYFAMLHNLNIILINLISFFVLPYLLWNALDSHKMFVFFIKLMMYFYLIVVISGCLEQLFRNNYIYNAIISIFPVEQYSLDSIGTRYGIKRGNSIFGYSTPYGIFCGLSFVIFYIIYQNKVCKKYIMLQKVLLILLPICLFFSSSRAIYLGIIPIVLTLVNIKSFFSKKLFIGIFCFLLSLPLIGKYISFILDSIFNSNDSSVGGSTIDMKNIQLDICLFYLNQSPIWGNGKLYLWTYVKPYNPDLLGAESLWYPLMVDYGLMGCLGYIFLIIACMIPLFKIQHRLIFFPLIYFFMTLLSPDVGVEFNVLTTYTVMLIRTSQYSFKPSTNIYDNNNS